MSDLVMPTGLSFRRLTSILLRHRWLIMVTAAVLTTLICCAVLLVSFQYTAKAELEIEVQQSGLIGGQAGVFGQPADESSVQTEMTALTSQDHERHVLENLSQDPKFRNEESRAASNAAAKGHTWWSDLTARLRRNWLHITGASGKLTLLQLEHHLNVYQERGSHAIAIAYTSTNPNEAALVANRFAQLYVERRGNQKRAATDRALAWLGERLPDVKNKMEHLELAAQTYRRSHDLEDANRTSVTDQQLTDLHKQVAAAEADLAAQRARLQSISKRRLGGGGLDDVIDQLGSPLLIALRRQEMTLLQAEAAEKTVSFSNTQPKLMQIRSELREVRRQIGVEVDRAVAHLMNEAVVAAATVQSAQQRLGTLKNASSDVPLRNLERDAAASRQLYETLLQRREELYQQRQSLSPGVHILSLAWPPAKPNSPSPLLFIPPALIASMIIGSLLAVAKDRLDRTLRSEHDIVTELGVPCLGLIPKLRRLGGKRPHDLLRGSPFDPYTEAIRSLVATLQQNPSPNTGSSTARTILITSSVPEEGKTTLAVSVATYAALVGKRTVLVDFDFRHPEILRELGGTADKNPLDFTQPRSLSTDLIRYSPKLRFDYLPISRCPVDPLMPFASGHMSRLLFQLRETYDCVIIDSAPLLAITETRVLAQMVDKIVLVVKWGSTRRDIVRNALGLLRRPGLLDDGQQAAINAVISQVDLKKHAGYGYGDSTEILTRYSKYYAHTP